MSAAIRAWVSETRSGNRSCRVKTGEPSFASPCSNHQMPYWWAELAMTSALPSWFTS